MSENAHRYDGVSLGVRGPVAPVTSRDRALHSSNTVVTKEVTHVCGFFYILKTNWVLISTDFMIIPIVYTLLWAPCV